MFLFTICLVIVSLYLIYKPRSIKQIVIYLNGNTYNINDICCKNDDIIKSTSTEPNEEPVTKENYNIIDKTSDKCEHNDDFYYNYIWEKIFG